MQFWHHCSIFLTKSWNLFRSMSTKDIFFSEIVSFKLIPRKPRMHFWQPWWNRFHEKPKYSAQCPEVIKVHLQAKGMLFPSNFLMYAWNSVLTNQFKKLREEAEVFSAQCPKLSKKNSSNRLIRLRMFLWTRRRQFCQLPQFLLGKRTKSRHMKSKEDKNFFFRKNSFASKCSYAHAERGFDKPRWKKLKTFSSMIDTFCPKCSQVHVESSNDN